MTSPAVASPSVTESEQPRPAVVVKIGGSLLTLPDLVPRVQRLLAALPEHDPLIVIGGGPAADLVRNWEPQFSLGTEAAHWLALEAVGLNESLLLTVWPALRLARSQTQWTLARKEGRPALLCSLCFMKWIAQQFPQVPRDWTVTTDSIAGLASIHWRAQKLLLLKSCPLPATASLAELSQQEFVDGYFPQLANELPQTRWINLREPASAMEVIHPNGIIQPMGAD